MIEFNFIEVRWRQVASITPITFVCGFCNIAVQSHTGMEFENEQSGYKSGGVYICPACQAPNSFDPSGDQLPSRKFGNQVGHVPTRINELYEEARQCTSHGSYTAAVMLLRKLLMTIAVEHGDKEGKNFVEYVDFILEAGLVQKKAKPLVDQIRTLGNEANHKVEPKTANQAKQILSFAEMILKTNYEYLHGISSEEKATK